MDSRTAAVLARQRADLVRVLDARESETVAAWVRAWDEVATELEQAVAAMWGPDGAPVSAVLRARQLTRMQRLVAERLDAVVAETGAALSDDARRLVADSAAVQIDLMAAQVPAHVAAFQQVPAGQMAWIVDRTTEQITSRLRPLSDDAARAVRRSLRIATAAGEHPRVAARRMLRTTRGAFDGGLTRAVTIARTELIDAHRAAAKAVHDANADMLTGWMWWASLSARSCVVCIAQHGTVHDLDEPGPQGHPRCRCTRLPVMRGTTARFGPTGAEWFDRQPADVREAILGPERAARYDEGTPLAAMIHLTDNPGWRPSWAVKPL